jgi:hypothetical protein
MLADASKYIKEIVADDAALDGQAANRPAKRFINHNRYKT